MVEFIVTEPKIEVLADEKTLIERFGLTPFEAKFLQMMLTHSWVGVAEMPELVLSMRQFVYLMRGKLASSGVKIVSNNNGKYGLPPNSKMALQRALETVTQGE
jgi:hypothetical protein